MQTLWSSLSQSARGLGMLLFFHYCGIMWDFTWKSLLLWVALRNPDKKLVKSKSDISCEVKPFSQQLPLRLEVVTYLKPPSF